MKKVKLGKLIGGGSLELDVHKLVETRMGVFASSGGGKSYALFSILEATAGMLPQVVLDREGEFSPLRKKYDFLLAGPGGDFPANPALASILCKKILEEDASCIIDLYELKPMDKHRFVQIFLETWLDAPKNLWRPRLLLVDEMHDFAPEKGQGESTASGAMIEIAEKGRKRKIGVIGATQRPAKVSKNFTAELGNKLVGVAYQDGDRKRAGAELEFNTAEQVSSLRRLDPGQFYAYGPALGHDIKLAQITLPECRPAGTGRGVMKAPAPTAKVKAILSRFKDLPKEAQEEARTNEELRNKVVALTRELRNVKAVPVQKPIKELDEKEIKRLREGYQSQVNKLTQEYDSRKIKGIRQAMEDMRISLDHVINMTIKKHAIGTEAPTLVITSPPIQNFHPATRIKQAISPKLAKQKFFPVTPQSMIPIEGGVIFGKAEKAILKFLAPRGERLFTKVQVGVGANYAHESPSFRNALSNLCSNGIVGREGNMIKLLDFDKAANIVGDPSDKEWNENLLDVFMTRFGKAEREIMQVLLGDQNGSFTKQEIAIHTPSNYAPGSPSFRNAMSKVNSLGLTTKEHDGRFRINKEILDL